MSGLLRFILFDRVSGAIVMDHVLVFSSAISSSLWFFLLFQLVSSTCPFPGPLCKFLDHRNISLCQRTVDRIKNHAGPPILFLDANATYQPELIQQESNEGLTVRVWVPTSMPYLQLLHVEFLLVFKDPLPNIYPFRVPSESSSLLDVPCLLEPSCNLSQKGAFSEIFNLIPCVNYDVYYSPLADTSTRNDSMVSGHRIRTHHTEESFAWNLQARISSSEGSCYDLSLFSFAYTLHRRNESKCFSCLVDGSCSSSTPRKNGADCSCRIKCPDGRKEQNIGKIIGYAVGSAGGLLVLAGLVVFFLRRFKPPKRSASLSKLIRNTSCESYSMEKDMEALSSQTHIFSYKELEEATEGFADINELGDGGFGTVYKGKLRDGRVVAIKRLYENNFKREEQFLNEVAILNRLRHKNLVSLYGCTSRHSRGLLLVYEYVPNGTVADHLHGSRVEDGALTWPVRMNIAVETAGALTYLHAVEPQIIHRDVKTNNILLDENYHVKVADFGLSRLFPPDATHVSTVPQGTPGYLDPEYHQCYQLTDKSDVYSFGVVLAELISSKPAVDITRKRNEINLASMAISRIQNCQLQELVDPLLGYDSNDAVRSMIEQVAELAFRCLQAEKEMRPSMEEVLEVLKGITGAAAVTRSDHSHLGGKVDPDRRKFTDDCASLLNGSVQYSPDTVHADWASRTTTPNTSGQTLS